MFLLNLTKTYHIVLYHFQMHLEEDVSSFLIFWSTFIGKSEERKKNISTSRFLRFQPISTANPAMMSQIGCADWLVAQKSTGQIRFFSFPTFALQDESKI